MKPPPDLLRLIEDYRQEYARSGPQSERTKELLNAIATAAADELRPLAGKIAADGPKGGPSASEMFQTAWADRIGPAAGPDGPPIRNRGQLSALLRRMLRFSYRDLRRDERAKKRGGGRPASLSPDVPGPAASESDSLRLDVAVALGALSSIQQEVFVLRAVKGWSRREVAERLGMSDAQVRAAHEDARRSLARTLASYAGGGSEA